jgi:predicted nucleic acid-binding protein
MIAASALDADYDTLWSEDMQHGMVIDGRLRVVNPFCAMGDGEHDILNRS